MSKMISLFSGNSFVRLSLLFSFFLAAALIPVIGIFFLFTLPQMVFVLGLLNNSRKTLAAFLIPLGVIFIVLAVIKTPLPALAPAAMGLAGMLMIWTVRKNYSIEMIVLLPSAIMLSAIIVYFVYGGMQLSISPWQLAEKHIQEAIDLNIRLYSRLPLSPEEIKAIQDSRSSVIDLFTRIFPALCILAIMFTAWINTLISKRILLKSGIVPPQFVNLSEWKAPPWVVWIFLASGGLMLIPDPQASFAGVNAFLSLSFIYFLQGTAIVSFFFQKKDISPVFRGVFYFFVAIQQMLMIAIAALGFFDIWIDFRRFFRTDPAASE